GNARADYFMPFFLDAESRTAEAEEIDSRAEEAARLLTEWDRRYTKDNTRAVLFELAMDELVDRTWDELNEPGDGDGRTRRVFTPASAVLAVLLNAPHSVWWDDTRTVGVAEDRDDILIASLAAALERAKAQHGEPDGGDWRWDRVRNTNIYHLLGLESLSVLGLPIQGGPGSLNPSSGRGIFGASWRMVVQLGPEVEAWSIYPGGQSGNPVSSRYIDRVDRWVEGKLDPVLFPRSPSDLDAARTASILELNPER
ncbi:MAG: penicillin acylase family protein, partial [Gemmatimonadota bacterium]